MLPGAISDEVCREASDWLLQQSAAAERSGQNRRGALRPRARALGRLCISPRSNDLNGIGHFSVTRLAGRGGSSARRFAEWRLGRDPAAWLQGGAFRSSKRGSCLRARSLVVDAGALVGHGCSALSEDAPASDYSKLGYTKTDVLIQEGSGLSPLQAPCANFRGPGFRMKASTAAPDSYLQRAEETTKSLISAFPPGSAMLGSMPGLGLIPFYVAFRGQFPLDVIREELNSLPAVSCRLERCPRTAREFLPCVVRRMVPGTGLTSSHALIGEAGRNRHCRFFQGGRRREGNVHMDSVTPGSTLSVNVCHAAWSLRREP